MVPFRNNRITNTKRKNTIRLQLYNLKGCYGTKKENALTYHYFEIQKRGLDIIEGLVTFQIKKS